MEIEKLLEIVRDTHEQAYQLGYKHGQQSVNINRATRVGDKDASEVGGDECPLHSAAVSCGRVVEEGEEWTTRTCSSSSN